MRRHLLNAVRKENGGKESATGHGLLDKTLRAMVLVSYGVCGGSGKTKVLYIHQATIILIMKSILYLLRYRSHSAWLPNLSLILVTTGGESVAPPNLTVFGEGVRTLSLVPTAAILPQ